jgi:hypothetical protein
MASAKKFLIALLLFVPAFALSAVAAAALAGVGYGPGLGAHIPIGWGAWALFSGAYLRSRPVQLGGAALLLFAVAILALSG